MEPVNAAIIYYSATCTVHALAQAPACGCARSPNSPPDVALEAACYQARRAVGTAAALKAGRAA